MSPGEGTKVVAQTEDVEATFTEKLDAPRKRAPHSRSDALLRYALLAASALFAVWLAVNVRNSISQIGAQVEMTNTNLLSPAQ